MIVGILTARNLEIVSVTKLKTDVVGIGNAIVDVFAICDDDFLARNSMAKGVMTLVDHSAASALYTRMDGTTESSGGSAANTVAGIAALGGQTSFIGKTRDDELGEIFRNDIQSLGVHFDTPPTTDGAGTARCLVFVTDDAQRTMATYLGACVSLVPDDIAPDLILGAKVTYLEGYLWDPPEAKLAFRKAAKLANDNGRQIALSLSDPFCVERYRKEFMEFIRTQVDIVFANEDEIISLYMAKDFREAVAAVKNDCELAVITLGAKGSLIVTNDGEYKIEAAPVETVVDTTGAGDLYAAGFLYGYTAGRDTATCGLYGSRAAAEVISHFGARPERPLKEVVVG